ncbi:D-3-phosphoglycerate dehydrogenase [Pasteurella testudinis DSM 23072]|uniref:D-3-phosphoglycerate dehydrogenase n=1 Tax=Pasteurella testudinis DSM 23072 TaxID=1122938 RepID=A0A1W1V0I2_9PAST|nr:hydroxyacid dehydrogenase [Pasteurella testudinis]SMB86806.1 D-3-phosphoglycerate dehydrogenase [Pasteurella testudinis DSM 23072]SUB50378.1 D-3-phosphoglycerate dehydrogenase [Pasteurella testudinis]
MKKVVISHRLHDDGMAVLEQANTKIAITNDGSPAAMLPELLDADGLIIRIGSIDRQTMLQAKNLKVIGRPGVGVDDVDVKTATELGIPVVIAPGANTRSVAEHAFALMFACAKDLLRSDKEMRKGNFAIRSSYKAYELNGKTLALIGYGRIGSILAQMSSAIGMQVKVYDPFVSRETIEKEGYIYCSQLDEAIKQSHVISIHVPLTPETRNLIGAQEIGWMSANTILINCARGEVIDEAALTVALEKGLIHSAGLDVFASEPVDTTAPLFELNNVTVSPHMAGQTKEAASGVATMAAEGVLAVINGERWENVCNPEAYNHPRWNK